MDKGWKEPENPKMLRTSFVDGRLQSEARFMHREECQPPCVEIFFCTIGLGEGERKHKWQFLPPSLPLLSVWTRVRAGYGPRMVRVREEEAEDLLFTATILDFRLWQLCIQYLL